MDLEQVYEIAAYDGFLGAAPDPKYANHEDGRVCLAYRQAYEEFSKDAAYPTNPPIQEGPPQGDPMGDPQGGTVNPNAIPEGGEPDTPEEAAGEDAAQNNDDARTILHSLEQELNTTEQEMEDAHQARNFDVYEKAFKRYKEIAENLSRVRKQISKETTTSNLRTAQNPADLTREAPPELKDPNRDEYESLYQKTMEEFGRDPQVEQDDMETAVHKAYNLLRDTNVSQVNNTDDAFEHVKMFMGKQDKAAALIVSAEIPMNCPACSERVAHIGGYFKCANDHWSELVLEPETKTAKYDKSSPPKRINHLPEHEQHKWIAAYNSAAEQDNDEESCNRIAWSNVSDKHKNNKKDSGRKRAIDEHEFNSMMGKSIDPGMEVEITRDGSGDPGSVYKAGDRGFILRKVDGFGAPGNEVYLVDFEHLHGNDWNNEEMYVPESDFQVVDNLEQLYIQSGRKRRG